MSGRDLLEGPQKDRLDDKLNPANPEYQDYINSGLNDAENFANNPDNASEDASDTGESNADKPEAGSDGQPSIAEREAEAGAESGNQTAANDTEQQMSASASEGKSFRVSLKAATPGGIVSRNKGKFLAGGIGIVMVPLIIAAFLAPSFVLNYIVSMMTDKVADVATHQNVLLKHDRIRAFRDNFSLDGHRGGKLIGEMERHGYSFEFDDPANPNKITGLKKYGATIADIGGEVEDFMDYRYKLFGINLRTSGWRTRRLKALQRRFGVSFEPVNKNKAGQLENPDEEINKRNYKNSNTNDVDIDEDIDTEPSESGDEAADSAEDAERQRMADAVGEKSPELEEIEKKVADGGTLTEAEDRLVNGIDEGLMDPGVVGGAARTAAQKFAGGVAKLISITELPAQMCNIQMRLDVAEKIARGLTTIALMRAAYSFITADDGQRTGEAGADLTAAILKHVATHDYVLGNFGNSTGFQQAATGTFSENQAELDNTPFNTAGKLTGFFGALRSIVKLPEFTCGVLTNTYGRIAIDGGALALSIFSGGSSTAAQQSAAQAFKAGFQAIARDVFTKKGLAKVGVNIAANVGLELAIQMASLYAQKKLTLAITGQEDGGRYSNILFAGMGVAQRMKHMNAGQPIASADQYETAYAEYQDYKKEELQSKSVFAKLFDLNSVDSLASRTYATVAMGGMNPNSVQSATSSILNGPSNLFASLTAPLTARAAAQDPDRVPYSVKEISYNGETRYIAVDSYDNPMTVVRDDIASINFNENYEFLTNNDGSDGKPYLNQDGEPESEDMKSFMDACIETSDIYTAMEDDGDTHEDCMADETISQRFFAYLDQEDTYDFINSALDPESIVPEGEGGGQTGQPTNPTIGAGLPCEGSPRTAVVIGGSNAKRIDWTGIAPTGQLDPPASDGSRINYYIREPCDNTNVQTLLIVSSIHGTENGGQLVGHELLFNAALPSNVRVVLVADMNRCGIALCNTDGSGRVNKNDVNLNRNTEFRWNEMDGSKGEMNPSACCNSEGGQYNNYRGPSPNSEPETQAVQAFIDSLGPIALSIHYHDNLNYVASSGYEADDVSGNGERAAELYKEISGMPQIGSDGGNPVAQKGSLDGWQANKYKTPVLLVELNNSTFPPEYIQKHVDAIQAILAAGFLPGIQL